MTINLTLGWWLAPLAITFAAAAWAVWKINSEEVHGDYSFPIMPFFAVPVAIIVTLSAWLVWSLLA